jgi:dTDP-4-dehydrorhamnose reductase
VRNSKAVLIVGGSGTIGTHLALRLRENYRVYSTFLKHPFKMDGVTSLPLSLLDRTWCKRIVFSIHPEVIIYAAGNNDPEYAEEHDRLAELTHSSGPSNLLTVTDYGAPKFIYLSSCYVFDGGRGNYHEGDVVLPASMLGKLQVGGENYIRGRSLNYVVIRSSPILARGNGIRETAIDKILHALQTKTPITLPSNDLYSFTHVEVLVETVARLIDAGFKNKILHLGGLTRVSYYDMARHLAMSLGFDPSLINPSGQGVPGASGGYQGGKSAISAALANLDFSLNCSSVVENLKIKPLLLKESLDLIKQDLIRPRGIRPTGITSSADKL